MELLGIQGFERAPSGRASCFLYGGKIERASWRFDYRMKASSKLGDQRRIHVTCVSQLPVATRAADLRALRAFMEAPDVSDDQRALLEAASAELAGGGASASSSCA
jgi:hypothetical protein